MFEIEFTLAPPSFFLLLRDKDFKNIVNREDRFIAVHQQYDPSIQDNLRGLKYIFKIEVLDMWPDEYILEGIDNPNKRFRQFNWDDSFKRFMNEITIYKSLNSMFSDYRIIAHANDEIFYKHKLEFEDNYAAYIKKWQL